MNARWLAGLLCFVLVASSCNQDLAEQLKRLQVLLQSPDFALEMASYLDAAYYRGQGQTPPPFIRPEEEGATSPKSVMEEKIAINLASFYAVESGIGVIGERTHEAPVEILESIVRGARPTDDMRLLARLANATWKAGQPFRSLRRITRDNFRPAVLLSEAEVKKDLDQINAASLMLLDAMRDLRGRSRADQLNRLQVLLQSREFALAMAAYLDGAYYRGIGQAPPAFLALGEETAVAPKSVKEEKIAINLAGLYAVEAGLGVIAEQRREMPMEALESVVNKTRSETEMLLLARFANATWKAGQPFRSLSRITRSTFRPAALLSDDELKKDFDQIIAASQKLLEAMRKP